MRHRRSWIVGFVILVSSCLAFDLNAADCNHNGREDSTELAEFNDVNDNGILDDCEGITWTLEGPRDMRSSPDTLLRAEYVLHSTPSGPFEGMQGWAVGILGEGLRIVSATSDRTVAADSINDPVGLRLGGFEKTEFGVLDGQQGIVSAIVFSWTQPIVTPTDKGSDLLRITVEARTPAETGSRIAQLLFRDGLVGSGQAVNNRATRAGQTFVPQTMDREILVSSEPRPFRRGDINNDSRIDISDSIALLNFLFLGGTVPNCADAADADDGGTLDLTDAIIVTAYLFLGDVTPSAPGPTSCGIDPTTDELGCAEFFGCDS